LFPPIWAKKGINAKAATFKVRKNFTGYHILGWEVDFVVVIFRLRKSQRRHSALGRSPAKGGASAFGGKVCGYKIKILKFIFEIC
jgi:hypothetical protein